ncbi:mandelate racemase [Acidobacteria bacterium AB60]|nr:mandelate racemase [Acidobacteria bacterium AB60]
MNSGSKISEARVSAYRISTDAPEADGTFTWEETTLVLVELACGSVRGMGYTYADVATAKLAEDLLLKLVRDRDPFAHGAIVQSLFHQVRNVGTCGIGTMAISAIDNALWDLRARLLHAPLVNLLGRVREEIEVYGSGGFTSYDDEQLRTQLGGWAAQGFKKLKMKVGSRPLDDPRRVRVAREAVGKEVELFVDANGAYTAAQAMALAEVFSESGVRWFEEPVSSDDLAGMRMVRERVPGGMDVAAGEYGYTAWYFRRMVDSGAVSVLQADATRCGGISGFLDAGSLCWAANLPLSSHCAPSLHLHVCCAVPRAIHMEYFHDHARIEQMLFDGFCEPRNGRMAPDCSRAGMGLELKKTEADRYRV